MTEKVDIAALAALARLEVPEAELAGLEKKIPEIISFVEIIQKAVIGKEETTPYFAMSCEQTPIRMKAGSTPNAFSRLRPPRRGIASWSSRY